MARTPPEESTRNGKALLLRIRPAACSKLEQLRRAIQARTGKVAPPTEQEIIRAMIDTTDFERFVDSWVSRTKRGGRGGQGGSNLRSLKRGGGSKAVALVQSQQAEVVDAAA